MAPSVWAWRRDRARKFAKVYDEIFTLFKFENEFFNKYGLKTTFIGHPIYHISSVNKKNNKKQHPLLINKYNPSLIKINLIVLFNVM